MHPLLSISASASWGPRHFVDAGRQTERQRGRQAGRQTGRQAGSQGSAEEE